ncbi:MAG TPA: malate synthase A [Thermoanaerobaculia bacterium]|nr:malate synthase A [Thermoanaerobaculia bacterium]
MSANVEVAGRALPESEQVLTRDSLAFIAELHRRFNPTRVALLAKRAERFRALATGHQFGFLPETESVRRGNWKVASTPADLQKRHVEITGPVESKMMINALNSGADVFMADFEDALSPTWENVVVGHVNLMAAVRRTLTFAAPTGKAYKLNVKIATLLVRPRGWHLHEKHILVDGSPISASLADFGLAFFHNAKEQIARGTGPYYYLPKMESHLEARLWNEVFFAAENTLGVPRGSVRATMLIETLPAAFEMDEMLYELREHASGLNAGRWDYIFSTIKKLRARPGLFLPDRAQITMTVPFMRAYTELLIRTCHRRGAHAMGGMAPFIPSRKDPEINEAALAKVRQDKEREAGDGFDGTWVAHPDLVPVAKEVFDRVLGPKAHQKERLREDVNVRAEQLVDTTILGGTVTEKGLRNNINVGMQYLANWFSGNGAAGIFNLMEDVATAEISRAQLWLWVNSEVTLDDGRKVDRRLYNQIRDEEVAKLGDLPNLDRARAVLDTLVGSSDFPDFLTLPAYEQLD